MTEILSFGTAIISLRCVQEFVCEGVSRFGCLLCLVYEGALGMPWRDRGAMGLPP